MFKALVKTRILELGAWLTNSISNSGKRASKLKIIGFGALMLYVFFAIMMMFGMYFAQIAEPFFNYGIGWLYFTFFGLTAFALMFIGSVFTAKSQLYEAKDNEFLLSLPIPPKYILASRMIMLMIINIICELVVAVPALIIWVSVTPVSVGALVSFILILIALPFFSIAISGLFGWLLTISTSRLRNNSLMTVFFSVIFLGLYIFFFSQANVYIQKLIVNGNAIAGSLGSVTPIFWLGNAIAEPNVLNLLYSLAIMILPFLLMYCILSTTFISVTTTKHGVSKVKYEERAMRTSSLSSALFRRELKHLLSAPAYILNAGLGVIFLIIGAGALIVKRADVLHIITQIDVDTGMVTSVIVLGLCLISSTVLFTAPSVSLEGKTIWIVKSLPIPAKEALKAKLRVHIRITTLAVLLPCAASVFVFMPSAINTICLILAPTFFVMFSANIGLICNLNHVNLNWINETQTIKQSVSVLLTMLINSMIVLVPGVLYLALLSDKVSAELFLIAFTVLNVLGWRLSYNWIITKGATLFEKLG